MNMQEKEIRELADVIEANNLLLKRFEEIIHIKEEKIEELADIIKRLLKGEKI